MRKNADAQAGFSLKRAWLRWIVLALSALALQGVPFLFMLMEGDAGMALYLVHLYAVIPLCAFFIPLWAGKGGVHPLAAFFPVGGALLLLPVYESPGVGLICLMLSLTGAAAGQEWGRRSEKNKGGRHGAGKGKK